MSSKQVRQGDRREQSHFSFLPPRMQQIDLYRRSKVERPATKFQSHCNLTYITVHQSRFGKADCRKQGHVSFLPASFFLHA
jgi:hypothetical protein